MNSSGRVYHSHDYSSEEVDLGKIRRAGIGDHLSDEQILRFATLLAEVVEAGAGQVTITVNKHHVLRVLVMFDEALPKIEESPPINPNFRG